MATLDLEQQEARRSRRLWRSFVSAIALVAASTAGGIAGEVLAAQPEGRPALQALDRPVAAPAAQKPEDVPSVQRALEVHRPASVSDEKYAAEKAAADTAQAPLGAVKIPVPGGSSTGAQVPTVTTNFLGLNRLTAANHGFVFFPPDTIAAKSPNRVIEAVNSAVRLFDTAGGVLATADLNTFFGAPTSDSLLFDPKLYYDRNAANPRVYVVALQVSGRGNTNLADNVSRMWVAVSRSSDPTNLTTNWCRYNIDSRSEIGSAAESWGDYPGIGAGADTLSMTLNNFAFSNDAFRFARIHVLNKNIASNNASSCPSIPRFVFQPSATAGNFALFTIQPGQHYTSPSSATGTTNPAYYLSTTRGTSSQYHVHRVRNVASGSPTYTRVTLSSTGYGIPPSGTQPGTTTRIDSGDNRMLQGSGIGNTLIGQVTTVCNFTIGTTNESCTLTPRVAVGIGTGGALTASIPENNFSGFGDNIYVHHPSIATDTALRSGSTWEYNGNSFSLSSAAMIKNVNANWTGVQTYAPGSCSYTGGGTFRSGDFSGAQLDPSLAGFWLAGEQAVTLSGSCQWQTRIARLNP